MELTCARPYAKAAFEHARDGGLLDTWSAMLATCAAVVQHEKVQRCICSPDLTAERKGDLLIDLCAGELDPSCQNFIRTLAAYGRITLLPYVVQLFELFKAQEQQSIDAELVSAVALSESQQAKIVAKVEKKLGRKVRLNTVVDAGLIGGMMVRAGDFVIDSSIRTRLQQLADAMNS